MFDGDPPGGPVLLAHHPQQLGPGGRERMERVAGNRAGQGAGVRERRAILQDEPAQRPAIAQAVERPGQERQVDVRGRLVPGPERARRHVLFDRLGRCAQPGVLPVVDYARAVGRQVGQPPAGHHPLEDPRGAVAEQVGAVDQQDRRPAPPGGPDRLRGGLDQRRDAVRARWRGRIGIDQDLVGPGQAPPRGQRPDPQLRQVEWLGAHFWDSRYHIPDSRSTKRLSGKPRRGVSP